MICTDSDSGLSELANSRPGSSPDEGIGTELLDQKGIRFMLIMLAFRAAYNNGCCLSRVVPPPPHNKNWKNNKNKGLGVITEEEEEALAENCYSNAVVVQQHQQKCKKKSRSTNNKSETKNRTPSVGNKTNRDEPTKATPKKGTFKKQLSLISYYLKK